MIFRTEISLLCDKSFDTYCLRLSRLVQKCVKLEWKFEPMYVLTDFETSAMAAVMSTWPTTELRDCRFHLGQSWWRRIQQHHKQYLQNTFGTKIN